MWRVQTEPVTYSEGWPFGVVSPSMLEDSPDGEFISSGHNHKGASAVAIGRQGNFLHWGFSASPAYMTEPAKLVFVNAIHYIARFRDQPAFVTRESVFTRESIDDAVYWLRDAGWEYLLSNYKKSSAKYQKVIAEYRQRQQAGETLSDYEQKSLQLPAPSPPQRGENVKQIVGSSVGNDISGNWDTYADYLEENRAYFYPGESNAHTRLLVIDEDARSIGIANNDVALLDHCVRTLADDPGNVIALRLLFRYTNRRFRSAAEWAEWLQIHRESLFFTEVGGFKFMAGPQDAVVPSLETEDPEVHESSDPEEPVSFAVHLKPTAPGFATLTLRLQVRKGWYIYAAVPDDQPFHQTFCHLVSDRLVETDIISTPPPDMMVQTDPLILGYEGEVHFSQDYFIVGEGEALKASLTFSYQACTRDRCEAVVEKRLTLSLEQ